MIHSRTNQIIESDSEVTELLISKRDDQKTFNTQHTNVIDPQITFKFPNNFKYVVKLFDKVYICITICM